MRLLDIAHVTTGDMHFPLENDPRACSVGVELDESCTEGVVTGENVITAPVTAPDPYTFRPFGIVAKLERRVSCSRPDDQSWLGDALKDATDQAVGRSLVVQPYQDAEVWVGAAGTVEASTVTAGRTVWTNTHVSSHQKLPILHLAPELLPQLAIDHVVRVSDDGLSVRTVWGDPVVVNAGYSGFPAFWTGDISIYLSTVLNNDELWRDIRGNLVSLRAHRVAAVDISPCSIVRVGVMPI